MTTALTPAFHSACPALPERSVAALEPVLAQLLAAAAAAHPQITVAPARFAAHLGRALERARGDDDQGKDPLALLSELKVADLYLACACADGDPEALRVFEQRELTRVPAYLASFQGRGSAIAAEITQALRLRLLCPREDSPGLIASYGGRGALASFVRVTAVRLARDLIARPAEAVHQELSEHLMDSGDPELQLLRERSRQELTSALRAVVAALPPEQRNLLVLTVVERRSTTELGRALGVNQSTVSRRLATARQAVYEGVTTVLQQRLNLDADEFRSLLRLVGSQLDMSLGLREPQP